MGYYITFLLMGLALLGGLVVFNKITTKRENTTTRGYYRSRSYAPDAYAAIAVTVVAAIVIPSIIISFGMYSETVDTEIWNGKVVSKKQETVSCRHSYSCNCLPSCSGSGKDMSCTTVCDTCYEHSHDYDWDVNTTIGQLTIDAIDRQGVREPPRWTAVVIGEPTAKAKSFTNYIKAARNNVLNREGTKITYPMPAYPAGVYDYYRIDRAVTPDSAMPNLAAWNTEISNTLRELGPSKQVNLVMVFTKSPEAYAEQLNSAWLGGKKNDVIIVVGTTDHVKADWVKVLSWTKREDFKVELRDSIMEIPLQPKEVLQVVAKTIDKKFDRRHMAEFKYLKYDIEPSQGFLIAAFISFFIPLIGFIIYRRNA